MPTIAILLGPHEENEDTEYKVDAVFDELDANEDDRLDAEELGDHWLAAKLERVDADGDGAMSRAELVRFKAVK